LAGRIDASLAASRGVDSADEVIEYLLVGADVAMTTASLLGHGIVHMMELVAGLESWLGLRDLHSLELIRGRMSRHYIADPTTSARITSRRFIGTVRSRGCFVNTFAAAAAAMSGRACRACARRTFDHNRARRRRVPNPSSNYVGTVSFVSGRKTARTTSATRPSAARLTNPIEGPK
jgi:hypothetical protein